MENHPIPQDITGFQFKLIGEMTVKQFAYLALGGVLGWVVFMLPIFTIIKLPIAFGIALFGAALAFVPVEGRPMDVMIRHFFKAVFSPTQYVYKKGGGSLLSKNPINQSSAFGLNPELAKLEEKEKEFLEFIKSHTHNLLPPKPPASVVTNFSPTPNRMPIATTASPQNPISDTPLLSPLDKLKEALTHSSNARAEEEKFKNAAYALENELREAKSKEAKDTASRSQESLETHQKVQELESSLNELMLQKQQLEAKLLDLQRRMQDSGKPLFTPTMAKEVATKATPFVKAIPQSMTKQTGLLATSEFPNLISGIIKDPRGNPLGNILVEVKDLQGNAVRAFKTNPLGQFASATSLPNGEYSISFEDPKMQNKFDTVSFEASGKIILPIEAISIDSREELRRSLFN